MKAKSGDVGVISPQLAGKRLFCLAGIVMRGQFELVIESATDWAKKNKAAQLVVDEHKRLSTNINSWIEREKLWNSLSDTEQILMSKPPGDWDEQEKREIPWRCEAAVVIAWSLNLVSDIPAYDQCFSDADLAKAIGGFFKPISDRVSAATLRSSTEIAEARSLAELWLWRARTMFVQNHPEQYKPPTKFTFDQIIRTTSAKAEEEGLFVPIDGDFPARGKAYRDLNEDEWRNMQSIATERLWGLNWLCGYESNWDEVPLGT